MFLLAVEAVEKSGGLFDLDATLPIIAAEFVLLVIVLNATFFKPLTKAIDTRSDYVRDNMQAARQRLAEAQAIEQQYESELATARRQTQDIVQSAQAEASKLRSEQIAAAMSEAQARVATAKADIERQKQEASTVLAAEVEALSRQILSKLLGNLA
jgi:F-type H+-transporting ATPase subunit b